MSGSTSESRQMAGATLVATLGRPPAEGGSPLIAPIVLGSTYRADGRIAYGRDGNPTVEALGGVETLIERRARYESEVAAGTPATLLRLSVGIEDVDDLWHDLDWALDR